MTEGRTLIEKVREKALTAVERRTIRFALQLACNWESSLIDTLSDSDKAEQAKCRRNIAKFNRLSERLR